MSIKITISNFKGGTGKTSSTVNIGAALAAKGHKVLLIDLDAQRSLTRCLNGYSDNTIYEMLLRGSDIEPVEIKENLDLIPASTDLTNGEIELSSLPYREQRLYKKVISKVEGYYDFILFDTNPAINVLTVNAYNSSDMIIAPLQAEFLAYSGFEDLRSILLEDLEIEVDKVFLTRYDKRKILARDIAAGLEENYPNKLFNTVIRENVSIAEAPAMAQDVISYAPNSHGAEDYLALTDELLEYCTKFQTTKTL